MDHSSCILVVPLYINHESLYPIVERFFDSLKEHYPDLDLVTVDDASPLPHDFKVTVKNEDNFGFTTTVNHGLLKAFHDPEVNIVIVANDDLTFKAGDLERFFELDSTKPIIASPMDTSASSDDRFGSIWGITRAAYEKLGPLDARYKHFYSDMEYYLRAKKKGVEIIKWYDITVEHPESATYKHVAKEELLEEDRKTYEQLKLNLE